MNNLPERKNGRLINYNYSSAGAYFLTVCTHNHKPILSDIIINSNPTHIIMPNVGAIHESPVCRPEFIYECSEIRLKPYGKILDRLINEIHEKYGVTVSDYVIMPNHFHLIVFIDEERAIRESPLQKRSLISKIIGYVKATASKQIHLISPDMKIWQRNYHDHIIRSDEEYLMIADYIHTNPGRWEEDRFFPR